jgi:hypothetical protein
MAIKHTVHVNGRGKIQAMNLTPRTAILYQCRECLGFETNPIECTSPLCSLFPFRTRRAFKEMSKTDVNCRLRGVNFRRSEAKPYRGVDS